MSGYHDPVLGLARLEPDGFGYTKARRPMDAPPAGTSQAIYFFRAYIDSMGANTLMGAAGTAPGWNRSLYWGLSFGGEHIDEPRRLSLASDPGLFGCYMDNDEDTDPTYLMNTQSPSSYQWDFATPCDNVTTFVNLIATFLDGNGDTESLVTVGGRTGGSSLLSQNQIPFTCIPANPAIGAECLFCWRVYTAESDERVFAQGWMNRSSFDIRGYDLDALDEDNPKSSIPPETGYETATFTINGSAETGTNWRPSSGVMAFPTHFIARWPFPSGGSLVISDIRVHYSQLYV